VTDHYHSLSILGRIVGVRKKAPDKRLHAKHAEEVSSHGLRPDDFGFRSSHARGNHAALADVTSGEQPRKALGTVAESFVSGICEGVIAATRSGHRYLDEFVRLPHRQRPKHKRIDDCE